MIMPADSNIHLSLEMNNFFLSLVHLMVMALLAMMRHGLDQTTH